MNQPSDLKIIIIDDNPAIHQDFIKILTRTRDNKAELLDELDRKIFGETQAVESFLPKFEIDTASQGQEGYQRIADALKQGSPYALAFVDIRMPPGWDGIETIQHIWELDKNIQIVICTAYSDYSWEETVEKLGHSDNLLILKKPFDNVAVRQLAVALTKKWQLMQKNRDYLASLEEKVLERTHSLEKSLSLTRATLESSNDGILVVDNAGKIVDYNNKFKKLLHIPSIILENGDYAVLGEYIQSQMANPDIIFNAKPALEEVSIDEIKLKNGLIFECYSQPHKLNDKIVGRVWSYRDVTQRVKLEQQLQHQATHDELTGLPNRFLIMDKLSKALAAGPDQEAIALFFLDIDRFKLINDSLSHSAGDQLIKQLAERLEAFVDDNHIVSRMGGDEFVILVTHVKSHEEIIQFATKVAEINKNPFDIFDRKIIITSSIGISLYPSISKTGEELLQHADAAMYYAKELGNNQFQFYTEELNKHTLQRLENESELRMALARNEFFLCYQPQVDITTEQLMAVEALIRWQHPTKGIILPLDFIPLAEETGIDVALGAWVMKTACLQNKEWQNLGLKPIRVAVNVTSQQLKQPNAVEVVKEILQETGLDPKYLELEVTENTIISDPIVGNTISELKKLGLQIVLDDFGTGYSSLNYLKKIAIDGLKIDRSFIQNINVDRGDEVIIRAIIAMAHSLNLEVLAEGVESNEQLKFLSKQKCIDVQGFYFSQPLLPGEIEGLLKKSKEIV